MATEILPGAGVQRSSRGITATTPMPLYVRAVVAPCDHRGWYTDGNGNWEMARFDCLKDARIQCRKRK